MNHSSAWRRPYLAAPIRSHRVLAVAALFAVTATPASALTVNFIDNGTVAGTPAELGFRRAAQYWESIITTPATINIEIAYEDLGPGILGGASSARYLVGIEGVYGQLGALGNSALDAQAIANLRPLSLGTLGIGALDVITPGYVSGNLGIDNATRVFDNDGSYNNSVIVGSGANLRALGYGIPDANVDVSIAFSSTFAFDFEPTDGIDLGAYDFIGVALHEIGHGLGFISGADDYDFLGCPNGPACGAFDDYPVNDDWWGYVMDLYRYSNDPTGVGPGGPQLDWAPGSPAFFSIDGGASAFLGGNYSTGTFNGDGWQASHWKQNGTCAAFVGIMNPYICNGTNSIITAADLGLFDAIGWNLDVDVLENPDYAFSTADLRAVPEPATWTMLLMGMGLVGAAFRRRARGPA